MSTDVEAPHRGPEGDIDPTEFDRYAVVAFATPDICQDVDEIHALAPPCGLPTLPAHVTVKGTFVEPVDLPEIIARIDRVARATEPIAIRPDRVATLVRPEDASVVVLVRPDPALTDLHSRLWDELHGLGRTIYGREVEGEFTPHLTLVQAIRPDEVPSAMDVIKPRDTQYEFTARTISLVGRRNGTDWETLVDFGLQGAADR
jgi:2'-5' RNA ligase